MITPSTGPRNGNAIGKALVEIGKALGKAVVAGVGLELARAATGHVKRIVGPKDKNEDDDEEEVVVKTKKKTATKTTKQPSLVVEAIDPEEVARIRKENEALRAELAALKSSSSTPD